MSLTQTQEVLYALLKRQLGLLDQTLKEKAYLRGNVIQHLAAQQCSREVQLVLFKY